VVGVRLDVVLEVEDNKVGEEIASGVLAAVQNDVVFNNGRGVVAKLCRKGGARLAVVGPGA
jgi:hypothetical protein